MLQIIRNDYICEALAGKIWTSFWQEPLLNMDSSRAIKHQAVVHTVSPYEVIVRIEQSSACASCSAAKFCTAGEHRQHLLPVAQPLGHAFVPGQEVTLYGHNTFGLKAVWWACVLPLILFVVVAVVSYSVWHLPEWVCALAALGTLVLYGGVLWLLRHKMERTFVFTIEAKESKP